MDGRSAEAQRSVTYNRSEERRVGKECNNKSYPVRAIVMLSQAKENRISRLKGLEALRKVMEQITINAWNSEFQIQAMDELEILLKEVPVYHLECDISEDAVRCLEDVLAGGRGEE